MTSFCTMYVVTLVQRQTAVTCSRYTVSPEMLSPRSQAGLETKILPSASVSKLWPRSRPWPRSHGLGLSLGLEALASVHDRQKIDSKCARQNDDIKVCGFDHNYKNSAYVVTHHLVFFYLLNFIFTLGLGLDLDLIALASASASTSKLRPQPRSWPRSSGLGLGLKILTSFNISECHSTIHHGSAITSWKETDQ